MISPQRRLDILDALRRGTVPGRGLETFAVGLERFERTVAEDLAAAERGAGTFKAIRGEYGSGKTFFVRWLQEQALRRGFLAAEVQISEAETPLHRLETVYRRMIERLMTSDCSHGALRSVIDRWLYVLEEDVLAASGGTSASEAELVARTDTLLEQRLAPLARTTPAFATALRAYRAATVRGDRALADGILAWLGGQPSVGAAIKREIGVKGDVDHFAALGFIQGLLVAARDAGHPGLLIVLDEVETLQRVRRDVREKALNALRQWIDEIDGGRFPGLFLVITGTPSFFDGPQGVQVLPPLSQRLATHFDTDPRFDNPRAVQIRLRNFDLPALGEVGRKVREIFVAHSAEAERVRRSVDDDYVVALATAVTGKLGGKVGVAPRVFLKKLVADVLDRVELYLDFDPRRDYALTLSEHDLSPVERQAMGASHPDEIDLDL